MNLITVSTHQLISYENPRINPLRKYFTHLIVVFPVALVDVRDDVARGAVLKVTLVRVLVRRVRGTCPVTPHFTVRTADWSVGYCSTIIIHTTILLRKLLDSDH